MIVLNEQGTPQLNTVHHCRAEALLSALDTASVDLVVTSPPYDNLRTYNGFSWNFEYIAQQTYRVLKPGGVLVWVVGDATVNGSESLTSFKQAIHFVDQCEFRLHDTMIYEALGTGAKGSHYAYWQAFEYMFVFAKGEIKTVNRIADMKNKTIGLIRSGRWRDNGSKEKPHATNEIGVRTNIWRYAVGFADDSDKTGHPAPYPEKLAEDHILSWSNAGDVVLDFFGGSGTTAKMARRAGRQYITCDISREYCDLMERRLAQPYTPSFMPQLESA